MTRISEEEIEMWPLTLIIIFTAYIISYEQALGALYRSSFSGKVEW